MQGRTGFTVAAWASSTWPCYILFLAILALAAYLRFLNLSDNPGWYSDEGTHIDIAAHLAQGRVQYMAVNQSTLLFAKMPLFEWALSALFRVFGVDMGTLRAFTAALGVLTIALMFLTVRRMQGGRILALLAAFMLATYPQAVLYSRFGFSYNLLAPLVLLTLLGLHEYRAASNTVMARRWLALAAVSVGFGTISDLMMFAFVVPLVLAVRRPRWCDLRWSLLLVFLPFGLYAAAMMLSVPHAFNFDMAFTLSRLNRVTLPEQGITLALNYTTLISQDFWMLAGFIGLFLLRPANFRIVAMLMFWLPLIFIGRTFALHSLGAYYMIPLLPLVALGAASLVRYGAPFIHDVVYQSLGRDFSSQLERKIRIVAAYSAVALVIATPLLTSLTLTVNNVQTHYPTAIESFLINPDDARRTAEFVNARIEATDVIIASPGLGWLFNANVADFQMAVAVLGEDTPHLPSDLPTNRFVFNSRHQNAHYVVVDNLWRNWGAVHIPGVVNMLANVESWPLVFEAGAVQVYQNPSLPS